MKSFTGPAAAIAAAMPLGSCRPATRALCQAASRVPAATPSMPTCQCGSARFASSRTRISPTVRKAGLKQPVRRRAPEQQQQQQQQQPAPSRGSASGGPMSGSIFPQDISILVPALEVAAEMMGPVLTEDEFTSVISSASKIVEARRPVSEEQLAAEHKITPYQLHMAAVLLLYGHKAVPEDVPSLFIALSLMHLATAAVRQPGGYLPSTLTIVNMIGAQWPQSPAQSEALRKTSIYKNAERQFLAYLAKQNSGAAESTDSESTDAASDLSLQADAFTLAGVLAEAADEPDRALQWYLAARELGNESVVANEEGEQEEEQDNGNPITEDVEPRSIKWSWEQRCLEGIGRLYAEEMKQAAKDAGGSIHEHTRTGEYKEARMALRTAAMALGSGKAGLLLATDYATMDDSGEDLDMMLYRAAVHAVPGTYKALALREATKASVLRGLNSTKVSEDVAFHQMMAEEWHRLAAAANPAQ